MKKRICAALVVLGLLLPLPEKAQADFWGADLPILAEILANAVQQLAQLQKILNEGEDTLSLLREINRGINDSLQMAETLGLRLDPGLYRELGHVDGAVTMIESVFGRAVNSPIAKVQRNTDQTVAEAITFNNELNSYAAKLDLVGEEIKTFSHAVSPGGAAKLTAQSMGVMIHVMNQQIRATGQGLKLQAQALAIQNKQEKDKTAQYLKEGQVLGKKMRTVSAEFNTPRF